MKNSWTLTEFKVYTMLYASHCNFIESDEEYQFIISKLNVDIDIFNKIHTEITMDNEVDRINKIKEYITFNDISYHQKENLLKDIKSILFADGTVDILEKNVYAELKKLLQF